MIAKFPPVSGKKSKKRLDFQNKFQFLRNSEIKSYFKAKLQTEV